MKRILAILTPLLLAWSPQAFPQDSKPIPTEVYKCSDGGKAAYQDSLCGSGPNKPLKTRDAKGIEAPKRKAAEYVPPAPAPVVAIPYTPSKPLGSTGVVGKTAAGANSTSPCRSASGSPCY